MQAAETKLERILEGKRQFLVPHFQRPYSWREKQWAELWRDLLDLVESPGAEPHFLGSFVSAPARSIPEGLEKRLLIDGQQRLTTLVLFLALLRDLAAERGQAPLADEINDLVVNRHATGLDRYKLLPTQGESARESDREAFVAIIDRREQETISLVGSAATFFRDKLRRADAPPLDKLFAATTARLTLVSVILDERDNPHRIFESLNGKGRPLSQVDLIRNYFFMRLPAHEHERVHRSLWQPMQSRLGEEVLAEFVRHYLMKQGTVVNEGDVYATLKSRLDAPGTDVVGQLEDLSTHARYYQVLMDPSLEPSASVRERLQRLQRLQISVALPFLLALYADRARERIDEATLTGILEAVETYVVRRFVCGAATGGLNKVFAPLYAQIAGQTPLLEAARAALAQRGCPRDAEFRERLASTRLYGGGERQRRTKLILERLERAMGHKEGVKTESLSIEHVMPQTPSAWWKEHLGEDWAEDHEALVHTLGNLTLTGYNPELSNAPFDEKRELLSTSHVELNRYFRDLASWRAEDIEARADALVDLAVTVWPYFGPEDREEQVRAGGGTRDVTSTLPQMVTLLGQKYPVRSWAEVLVTTLDALHASAPDDFLRVEEELSRIIKRDPSAVRNARRLRRLRSGAFVDTTLSAAAIHRICLQALDVMNVGPDQWEVERVSLVAQDGESETTTEMGQSRLEFWERVRAALVETSQFPSLRKTRPQHWYSVGMGRVGYELSLVAMFSQGRVRVRLLINVEDAAEAVRRLAADRAAIEGALGHELNWELEGEGRRRGVGTELEVDLQDHAQWPRAIAWMVRTAVGFRAVFGPRIAELDV